MAFVNLGQIMYPVGSVYQSFNNTSPSDLFGGTWEKITDKFLFGSDNANTTGGEKTHKLTSAEMPTHQHEAQAGMWAWSCSAGFNSGHYHVNSISGANGNSETTVRPYAGGDQPHNNMPPYITCYIWQRTS